MLFIVAGAFAGLEQIISQRVGKKGIGFGAKLHSKIDEKTLFARRAARRTCTSSG